MDVKKDELMHYGVLGMKWGVRKAERRAADGSRLSKKLSGYRTADAVWQGSRSAVKTARQNYRRSKNPNTKQAYEKAKSDKRVARANLNKAYFKVKNANNWQKGKQLHAEGKTITGITNKQRLAGMGLGLAGYAGSKYLARSHGFVNNRSNLRYSDLAFVPGAAAMATAGAMYVHGERQKKKLRAYYYG